MSLSHNIVLKKPFVAVQSVFCIRANSLPLFCYLFIYLAVSFGSPVHLCWVCLVKRRQLSNFSSKSHVDVTNVALCCSYCAVQKMQIGRRSFPRLTKTFFHDSKSAITHLILQSGFAETGEVFACIYNSIILRTPLHRYKFMDVH